MKYIVFLLLFIHLDVYGQNLLRNGSFEEGKCPKRHSIEPEDFQLGYWHIADRSTPDYYHKCGIGYSGIPDNWAGYQKPVQGDAYVGIYLKKGNRYQENLAARLKEPLIANQFYQVSFYISNAANAEFLASEIGVLITGDRVYLNQTEDYDFRQIAIEVPYSEENENFSWKYISFSYQSKGGEKYFFIGPLKIPNSHGVKNKHRLNEEPLLDDASYVYLDDIRVEPTSKKAKEPEKEESFFEWEEELRPVTVYFEFDDFYLSEATAAPLDTLTNFVLRNDLHLLISGGTDSLGTDEYNKELGLKRALSVKEYLSFWGIDEDRMHAITRGEETPNYSNHSEEYRRLNRNVLIEFYRKQ